MSRKEYHDQEKIKAGYDVSATNKSYWAKVKAAALEGKPVHPRADEEHRQIFGEAVPRGEPKKVEQESQSQPVEPPKSEEPAPKEPSAATPSEPEEALPTASQPTIPGIEPEKPSETPRQAATRQQAAIDADYEFARKSAVRNAGEDLKGSARHKRNEWRGLEDAEKNGTAADFVNRDNLLKAEPHELMTLADKNPLTALAMHFALRAFPAKPGYGNERQRARTDEATRKKDREQFVSMYREYKAKCEELAKSEPDAAKAINSLKEFVGEKIFDLRGIPKEIRNDYLGRSGVGGTDKYNNLANSLVDTKTNLLIGRQSRKTGVAGRLEEFAKAFYESKGDLKTKSLAELAEPVKDVIEGRSINETFGKKGEGKSKETFTAADKYVKHAKRVGGRDVSDVTSDANKAAKHLLDKFGARGVQFGNSVTDDERAHHAARLVESLADLADVTGLKPQDLGLGGKVGWAIGARGHGTALAHYEPSTQVINLTRKSGVGALAHEWGHAFDHSIHGFKTTSDGGDFASDHISPERFVKDESGGVKTFKDERWRTRAVTENLGNDPIWKAFDGIRKAFKSSGFQDRSAAEVRKLGMTPAKTKYWNSTIERFARAFEVHVQHALREKGRENTYLSGLVESGEGSLWPTPAESKAMALAFESLFAAYRQKKYGTDEIQKYSRQDLIESLAGDIVRYSLRTTVERAAAETNVAPSQSQIEAGNYRKGRFRLWGKEIVIENPRGSTRSGKDHNGKEWSVEMSNHYGYIAGADHVSEADGDHVDVYIGRHPESEVVFIVDQHDPTTGHFDEHKCFIGFRSAKEAKQCYLDAFARGGKAHERFGHIATMTKSQFLEWLDSGDTKYPVHGTRQLVKYASRGLFDEEQHPRGQPENAGQFAPKQGIAGQQRGLFGGDDLRTGQKSLFDVIAPAKPKGKAKSAVASDLFAGLQADIVEHLKSKAILSPADRGVVVQPESLPGQREMFSANASSIEKYRTDFQISPDHLQRQADKLGLAASDVLARSIQMAFARRRENMPVGSEPPKRWSFLPPEPESEPETKAKPKPSAGQWKRVGGSSVFVGNNGKIVHGCPGLKGHHVDDLVNESQESRDKREAKQSHATVRGLTGRDATPSEFNKLATKNMQAQHQAAKSAAKKSGVSTTDVLARLPDAQGLHEESSKRIEELKATARKYIGLNAGSLARIENAYRDHSTVPHFDELVASLQEEFPDVNFGSDPADFVWQAMRQGKAAKLSVDDHAREAATIAASSKSSEQSSRQSKIAKVVSDAFDDSFDFGNNVAAF
jgi:hypothetical protein